MLKGEHVNKSHLICTTSRQRSYYVNM